MPQVSISSSRAVGGVVLCGGKSTRMGTSKALLPFGPETMLQRVVRLLSEVVSPIVVVAAIDQDLPQLPSGVIVTRDENEGRGPLEGLRAGLKALPTTVDAAYVTSCDVPLLETGFVRQMIDLANDYDIAVMEIDGFHASALSGVSPGDPAIGGRFAREQSPATGVSLRRCEDETCEARRDDVGSWICARCEISTRAKTTSAPSQRRVFRLAFRPASRIERYPEMGIGTSHCEVNTRPQRSRYNRGG